MKVFIDEDWGNRVPRALQSVKVPCDTLVWPATRSSPITLGTPDTEWIPWVGTNGYLALSINAKILEIPGEFELLLKHNVGIVFLDYGSYPLWQQLLVLMNRWDWLLSVDRSPRPFAYIMAMTGRPRPYDLSSGPRRPRPYRAPPSFATAPSDES